MKDYRQIIIELALQTNSDVDNSSKDIKAHNKASIKLEKVFKKMQKFCPEDHSKLKNNNF